MSLNQVQLIGKLVADATTNTTPQGVSYTVFRVLCPRTRGKADFVRCVAWRQIAANLQRQGKLNKGQIVMIRGRLQSRQLQNAQGQTSVEVVINNEVLDLIPLDTVPPQFNESFEPFTDEDCPE